MENQNSIQVSLNATVQVESMMRVCRNRIFMLVTVVISFVVHVQDFRNHVVLNALHILSRFSKRLDSLVNVKQDIFEILSIIFVSLKR